MAAGYVGILSAELHFPDNRSLKGKRKELLSLKAQLQRRFGASVAEVDHHDLWQWREATARSRSCSTAPSATSPARRSSSA